MSTRTAAVAGAAAEPPTYATYDLTNSAFVAFFEARTGIQITRCECGWDKVRDVFANPAVPAPDRSWAATRERLRQCWVGFRSCGHCRREDCPYRGEASARSFDPEVYAARMERAAECEGWRPEGEAA